MRRPELLVALVLAVGFAGTAIALGSREGDPALLKRQQTLLPVSAAAVQRLLLSTRDPRPGDRGRARDARCTSASAAGLGDPWSCLVRYPQLPRVRYRLDVYADRSLYGSGHPEHGERGTGLSIRGCCVEAR